MVSAPGFLIPILISGQPALSNVRLVGTFVVMLVFVVDAVKPPTGQVMLALYSIAELIPELTLNVNGTAAYMGYFT
jgi:hypothetical protein